MGHTNSTANLSLPQFIGTDKPTWLGDVNGAFSAIDSYAGTNDAAVAAAASDASSAISQAASAVSTANAANTTAGNASTAATNAVTVANNAVAIAGVVDTKVGLLADLTTTDRTSIVNAINEVNGKDAGDIAYDNSGSGLTATNVQDAIDEVAQGGGGGSFTFDTLWTNPDDTQSFAPTDENVADLSTYKFFIGKFRVKTGGGTYINIMLVPDTPSYAVCSTDNNYARTLKVDTALDKISFYAASYYPLAGGSSVADNTCMVPSAIYGIK